MTRLEWVKLLLGVVQVGGLVVLAVVVALMMALVFSMVRDLIYEMRHRL
jgi:hypothetical protein